MPTTLERAVRPFPIGILVVLLALAPTIVRGQFGFTVSHSVGATTPTQVEVKGTVVNDTRAEALDVVVTVEALNSGSKVVARGSSFVSSHLAGGNSAEFSAKVPVVAGATSYRARVTSFRFVGAPQGP